MPASAPMLARMFDWRCRGYEAVGYRILLPASAVPGWPTEVPLPVDSAWKQDYAASVRRLVCDGVDVPLARLFVGAAHPMRLGADGEQGARSATEAFLYRRLESLPATAGKFRLNVELSIPFDGCGRMEVDLLCAERGWRSNWMARSIWITLRRIGGTGARTFLLQENGYQILRFLAEDVGKCLDDVLDTILRALAHQVGPQPR